MTKAIKFNLICDNKPVRTLEDLRKNFSVEDLLAYYENGLLKRWLKVRGYTDELVGVEKIVSKEEIEIAKSLVKVLGVESDEKLIEEAVYVLNYSREHERFCKEYSEKKDKIQDMLTEYRNGYDMLVNTIIENSKDVSKIKACVNEITNKYNQILALNYRELFWELRDKSLLGLMCLLMNEKSRIYYIKKEVEPSEDHRDTESVISGNLTGRDKVIEEDSKLISRELVKIANEEVESLIEQLGENLRSYCVTEKHSYFSRVEGATKKYMVVAIGELGTVTKAIGADEGKVTEWKARQINGKFIILDGLAYTSESTYEKLYYMEV